MPKFKRNFSLPVHHLENTTGAREMQQQLTVTEDETPSDFKELDQQLPNVDRNSSGEHQPQFEGTVQELKNSKLKDFQQYCGQQMRDTQGTTQLLKTSPRAMQDLLEKKVTELKNDFKKQLTVNEEEKSSRVKELDQRLQKVLRDFLSEYQLLFHSAVRELKVIKQNEFVQYCEQEVQCMNTESTSITNTPNAMRKSLETKSKQLLDNFRQSLGESAGEMEPEILKLQTEFVSQIEHCIQRFTPTFNSVIERLKQQKLMEFENFLNQKMRDTQDTTQLLKTSPRAMQNLLETKVTDLKNDFKKQLIMTEEEKSKYVHELSQQLWKGHFALCEHYSAFLQDATEETRQENLRSYQTFSKERVLNNDLESFCKSYELMFILAIWRVKKRMLEEFQSFFDKQKRNTQNITQRLKTSPRAMQDLLEKKVTELKNDFKKQLTVTEEEKSKYVKELDQRLWKVFDEFNHEYHGLFESAVRELKDSKLKDFEQYCKQQVQGMNTKSITITNTPKSMRKCLEAECKRLLDNFRQSLAESAGEMEPEISKLETELVSQRQIWIQIFEFMFSSMIECLKLGKLVEFQTFISQKMRETQDMTQRLKTSPQAMQDLLEKKVAELRNDFKKQLIMPEEEKSSYVKELDQRFQKVFDEFNHESSRSGSSSHLLQPRRGQTEANNSLCGRRGNGRTTFQDNKTWGEEGARCLGSTSQDAQLVLKLVHSQDSLTAFQTERPLTLPLLNE